MWTRNFMFSHLKIVCEQRSKGQQSDVSGDRWIKARDLLSWETPVFTRTREAITAQVRLTIFRNLLLKTSHMNDTECNHRAAHKQKSSSLFTVTVSIKTIAAVYRSRENKGTAFWTTELIYFWHYNMSTSEVFCSMKRFSNNHTTWVLTVFYKTVLDRVFGPLLSEHDKF